MKKVTVSFKAEERDDIGVVFFASEKDDAVKALMDLVSGPFERSLTVYDDAGSAFILPEDDVVSVSSAGKKLKIAAESGSYEMSMTMREMEERLRRDAFLRISRYEIINLHKVRKFDFSVSGSLRIEMKNGSQTWASRRFIAEIRKRLQGKGVQE